LKEADIMLRVRLGISLMLCLGLAAICIEFGRSAWADPASKDIKSTELKIADPPSDPKLEPPSNVAIPTSDPLFQAILQELKGGDDPGSIRLANPSENAVPKAVRKDSKVTAPESDLSSDDWLAIESMLKSARLLASESKKRSSLNQIEAAQSRSEMAALLRDAVAELIARSRSSQARRDSLQSSLPPAFP
jgi:hypothetical protein